MRMGFAVLMGLALLTLGCTAGRPAANAKTPCVDCPSESSDIDPPLKVGGEIKAPVLIGRVAPIYPLEARKAGIQGRVLMEAVVSREGRVIDLRVVDTDDPLLSEAALEAARKWRYQPATRDGKPVKVFLTITTTFRLDKTPRIMRSPSS